MTRKSRPWRVAVACAVCAAMTAVACFEQADESYRGAGRRDFGTSTNDDDGELPVEDAGEEEVDASTDIDDVLIDAGVLDPDAADG